MLSQIARALEPAFGGPALPELVRELLAATGAVPLPRQVSPRAWESRSSITVWPNLVRFRPACRRIWAKVAPYLLQIGQSWWKSAKVWSNSGKSGGFRPRFGRSHSNFGRNRSKLADVEQSWLTSADVGPPLAFGQFLRWPKFAPNRCWPSSTKFGGLRLSSGEFGQW